MYVQFLVGTEEPHMKAATKLMVHVIARCGFRLMLRRASCIQGSYCGVADHVCVCVYDVNIHVCAMYEHACLPV